MTDADADAERHASFLSRVFVAVSPFSRGARAHRDELASFSGQHHSFGATAAVASDDESDVEAFVDARSDTEFESDRNRASDATSNGRWASAPGRRLRALGVSALIVVAASAASLAPRDGVRRSSLAYDDSQPSTWVRNDAMVRSAPAGGRRLPPGYKRSAAWSRSRYSSPAVSKSWLAIASFGSLSWPRAANGLGTWREADARSWDPTKLRSERGEALPESFDVREKWPKCAKLVSEPVDQGECGSCWAVAPSKVMSDRLCIATKGEVRTHLSAMQLLACNSFMNNAYKEEAMESFVGAGCDGGYPTDAYENAYKNGIVSGGLYGDERTCMPYQYPPCQHPCVPNHVAKCPHTCHANQTSLNSLRHLVKEIVTCGLNDFDCMALEIFERGPVSTYVGDVYDEFYTYTSGVYIESDDEAARGANHGGHVMEVIGWGVTEDGLRYWRVYNSWLNWGHNGYGHIAVGELSIGENIEAAVMSP